MDANGQRAFGCARKDHWERPGDPAAVTYDDAHRVLRLASRRRAAAWVERKELAVAALERAPGSVDRFGSRARADEGRVFASGAFADEIAIYTAAPGELVQDVAIGFDDVLYLAVGGRVVLHDLRGRFERIELSLPDGLAAFRLAPRPSGGVYWLDRVAHRLGLVTGLPLRARTGSGYAPGTFRPLSEDPDPPRAIVISAAEWPDAEDEVAIACSPDDRLALLSWVPPDGEARLRLLEDDGRLSAPVTLGDVRFPYSIAWIGSDRIALRITRGPAPDGEAGVPEAAVYALETGASRTEPIGDFYPLRDPIDAPFMHGVSQPPEYPTASGGSRPLHRIAWPSFVRDGEVINALPIDSGDANTIWHRIYLEAALPPGCGVTVKLATSDDARRPGPNAVWHEHRFGSLSDEVGIDIPRGAWVPAASEIPFHPGTLACERRKDRSGLWTALVQRPGYRVRTLVGRYVWLRLSLHGDGRTSPELAALRIYGGRQSYVQKYLPELYREQVFGPEADEHGTGELRVASTRADFLERFVGNFEGILTPLEDRIKHSFLLTDPSAAPEQALDWLASWIGFAFAPALPLERRRSMLGEAMNLYRRRGTLRGLSLALDLATGGAVKRGEVVVFEDFRLRRTFATILGANFAVTEDPLSPGLSVSGNSFVGDTLFLGDEDNKEFLALFNADLIDVEREPDAAAAIAALFDRLAHRATVLVHDELREQDLGLIRQIVERESPAHVAVQVLTASQRFLVGMSSLVGIDTFLGRKPSPQPVRVSVSTLGRGDLIQRLPSLDPRFGHAPTERPRARVSGPATSADADSFSLDASASSAATGSRIVRYHWTLIE